jgi:hypothetical protein
VDREAAPVRRGAAAALVVVLGVLATACIPASPDADTYDDKAQRTLGAAVSEVRTVEKVLESLRRGRMFRQTAIAQLRYSQSSLDTATYAFTELNPPPQRDRLTKQTTTLLGDADDLLGEVRTTVERYHRDRYPALVKELDAMASDLERLEGRVW